MEYQVWNKSVQELKEKEITLLAMKCNIYFVEAPEFMQGLVNRALTRIDSELNRRFQWEAIIKRTAI